MFSDFYNDNKIIIYFTENENAVYNSLFFKEEFKYSQSLLFDIKKIIYQQENLWQLLTFVNI